MSAPPGGSHAGVSKDATSAESVLGDAPVVTFVVIAHNEAAGIEHCLRALAAQSDLPAFEIVVVDDCSDDATPFVIAQVAAGVPELRTVRLPTNLGRGTARAAGVGAAQGQLIAMVDSDIVLPPDWFSRCREHLEGRDVVSGTAVPDGDVGFLARQFGLQPKVVASATRTTGNNALFRRTVFEHVSYEEALREGEDVALDHQMDVAGVVRGVVPGLRVEHREHKTFRDEFRWLFESGLGASRQLERYRKVREPDVALAVMLFAVVAPWLTGRRSTSRLAAPVVCLALLSLAHVARKFEARSDPVRFLGATAADTALLSSYFAGRLAGHVRLRFDARAR
ncbi:MAG: glycosyltransferase family 2 protein [Acidimicrobiales bacterium]